MAGDSDALIIRPAARTDLPRIGRLGAQLVTEHHDLDSRRFLAANDVAQELFASAGFRRTMIEMTREMDVQ